MKPECNNCNDTGWFMMEKPGGLAPDGTMNMISFPQICHCASGKREFEKLHSDKTNQAHKLTGNKHD